MSSCRNVPKEKAPSIKRSVLFRLHRTDGATDIDLAQVQILNVEVVERVKVGEGVVDQQRHLVAVQVQRPQFRLGRPHRLVDVGQPAVAQVQFAQLTEAAAQVRRDARDPAQRPRHQ